jgi:glycine hydroxymethyltransferase
MLIKEGRRSMAVLRFRMNEKGIRVPKTGDPIANRRGQVIGNVTSCSIDREGYLVGLGYCSANANSPGTELEILTLPSRVPPGKDANRLEPGDRVVLADSATVLTRFVERESISSPLPGGHD